MSYTDDYIREMMHIHIGAMMPEEAIEAKNIRFDIMKHGILKTDEDHPRPLILDEDFVLSDYAENSALWIVTRVKVREKNDQPWNVKLVKSAKSGDGEKMKGLGDQSIGELVMNQMFSLEPDETTNEQDEEGLVGQISDSEITQFRQGVNFQFFYSLVY